MNEYLPGISPLAADLLEAIYAGRTIGTAYTLATSGEVRERSGRRFSVPSLNSPGTTYLVQVLEPVAFDEFPPVICGCRNGVHRGGDPRCYHSAAALIYLLVVEGDSSVLMTDQDRA